MEGALPSPLRGGVGGGGRKVGAGASQIASRQQDGALAVRPRALRRRPPPLPLPARGRECAPARAKGASLPSGSTERSGLPVSSSLRRLLPSPLRGGGGGGGGGGRGPERGQDGVEHDVDRGHHLAVTEAQDAIALLLKIVR